MVTQFIDCLAYRRAGFNLVGLVVGLALTAGVTLLITRVIVSSVKTQKRNELKSSVLEIRNHLRETVDCDDTFAANGINDGNFTTACTSTSAPGGQLTPFLRLRRKSITGNTWLFDNWDAATNTARFGDYTIRATCSTTERSLIVRIARMSGTTFLNDPVTNLPEDWSSPKGLLFGGGSTGLCAPELGAIPSSTYVNCADPEALITGIDLNSRIATCKTVRPAPYISGTGSGMKVQRIIQNRDGSFTGAFGAARLINACHITVHGHDDFDTHADTCAPGWPGAPLGYLFH